MSVKDITQDSIDAKNQDADSVGERWFAESQTDEDGVYLMNNLGEVVMVKSTPDERDAVFVTHSDFEHDLVLDEWVHEALDELGLDLVVGVTRKVSGWPQQDDISTEFDFSDSFEVDF